MTRPIYWTSARIADALAANVAGITYADIGAALDPPRSAQAVRNMLIREGVAKAKYTLASAYAWRPEEDDIVRANCEKPDVEISVILNKAGYKRTTSAVESRRRSLGLCRERRGFEPARAVQAGWPSMPGEDWERDQRFWKSVLRHGVETGVILVTR